jgi:hypothetical protein
MINKKVMLFLGGIVVSCANVEALNNDAEYYSAATARERACEDLRSLAIEVTNNAEAFNRGMGVILRTQPEMSANLRMGMIPIVQIANLGIVLILRAQPEVSAVNALTSLTPGQFTIWFAFFSGLIGKGNQPQEMIRFLSDPDLLSSLKNIFIERGRTYDRERAAAGEHTPA